MNWTLFLFVVAVGVSSGVLFRRRYLTTAEARSLVAWRVAFGLALAATIPAGANGWVFLALGVHEVGSGLAFGTAMFADRWAVRREARKWLQN